MTFMLDLSLVDQRLSARCRGHFAPDSILPPEDKVIGFSPCAPVWCRMARVHTLGHMIPFLNTWPMGTLSHQAKTSVLGCSEEILK